MLVYSLIPKVLIQGKGKLLSIYIYITDKIELLLDKLDIDHDSL